MFDVFYSGKKPNLFAHEQAVDTIEQAQQQSRTRFFWFVNYLSDYTDFDFLWEPVPWQAHQRHAWASQHQKDSGTYLVPKQGYTDTNYHDETVISRVLSDNAKWSIPDGIEAFNTTWHPDPTDPPMTYQFGTQHQRTGGPRYYNGSSLVKYVNTHRAIKISNSNNWTVPESVDIDSFDWTWHPDDTEPPYVYEFASEWHNEGGPVYTMPGAVDRKYISNIRAKLTPRHDNHWRTLKDCVWDYSWRPHPKDPPYIYVFGNQWYPAEKFPTVEYHVPDATERKYMNYPKAELLTNMMHWGNRSEYRYQFDYSWQPDPGDPPMTYVFGNQWWPAEKMPTLEWIHPDVTEVSPVKYMSYPRAELLPNTMLWTVPDSVDTGALDFSWVPDPGAPPYIYQFATQHQKTGGPVYSVPGAVETKYLEELKVQTTKTATAVIEIDHLDSNAGNIPNTTKRVRYFDNYRDTLIRIAKSLDTEHEYVWVCSSICDYTDFDFSWHPEKWQATMLHVFASEGEKFGDTFFMHVPTFAERAEKKALLEWYDVNFVDVSVPRRPMPVIQHTEDSHVDAVKNATWSGPLATFTTADAVLNNVFTVPLWRTETKTIVPLSKGASTVIVPRVAVGDIRTQLYDYPYINKTQRVSKEHPLDIVFISNGEKYAGFHEQQLYRSVQRDGLDCNRIHHSAGVNGRVAAYQAAAELSTTPWFFAVFAKLEVDPKFDWTWQPDRMQQTKHYIFHAYNPVNGLTYGHQAMIAYNKRMVLENTGTGLDFTLDQPHEVVPLVSGVANYNETPWMAWRTAFREVLKLKASLPDVESEYRLRQWLEVDTTEQQWSMKGAEDAVEYHDSVAGDFAALKKSYEWEWLATYAFMRRSLSPDR